MCSAFLTNHSEANYFFFIAKTQEKAAGPENVSPQALGERILFVVIKQLVTSDITLATSCFISWESRARIRFAAYESSSPSRARCAGLRFGLGVDLDTCLFFDRAEQAGAGVIALAPRCFPWR